MSLPGKGERQGANSGSLREGNQEYLGRNGK